MSVGTSDTTVILSTKIKARNLNTIDASAAQRDDSSPATIPTTTPKNRQIQQSSHPSKLRHITSTLQMVSLHNEMTFFQLTIKLTQLKTVRSPFISCLNTFNQYITPYHASHEAASGECSLFFHPPPWSFFLQIALTQIIIHVIFLSLLWKRVYVGMPNP